MQLCSFQFNAEICGHASVHCQKGRGSLALAGIEPLQEACSCSKAAWRLQVTRKRKQGDWKMSCAAGRGNHCVSRGNSASQAVDLQGRALPAQNGPNHIHLPTPAQVTACTHSARYQAAITALLWVGPSLVARSTCCCLHLAVYCCRPSVVQGGPHVLRPCQLGAALLMLLFTTCRWGKAAAQGKASLHTCTEGAARVAPSQRASGSQTLSHPFSCKKKQR